MDRDISKDISEEVAAIRTLLGMIYCECFIAIMFFSKGCNLHESDKSVTHCSIEKSLRRGKPKSGGN